MLQHKNILLNMFGVDNENKFLPVVSGFIICRLCLGADLIVHIDIVVHRLGVVGQKHIGIGGIGGIRLKYTKEFSYQLMDWI